MRNRRSLPQNINDRGQELSGERPGDREESQGNVMKKLACSSEMWEEYEMPYPGTSTRHERPTGPEDPFFAVGRMVKNAWRRVSQSQAQTAPSASPNGSAGDGDDKVELGSDTDAPNKISSEKGRNMASEWDSEGRRRYGHGECAKMSSVKEDCVLGSAPIHNSSIKMKKPVLVRSATEPWGKATTCGVHV